MKAEQLNQMMENDNDEAYKAVFSDACFKTYVFRVKVNNEIYMVWCI